MGQGRRRVGALSLAVLVAACAPARPPTEATHPLLTYLGQSRIPFGATFEDTVVGGLSAISYDAARGQYYVISDDRSGKNPARFYTMQLSLSVNGIGKVTVTGTHPLLDQSGQPFRPLAPDSTPPVVPPDPEGIAFDPERQRLYWSSEGERLTAGPILLDPWVRITGLDGAYLGQFTLPPSLAMSAQHTGPRRNRALEGLTLTPDGTSVFAAMEDPGYNDGPETDDDHQVLTRIIRFDATTGTPTAQYAYPMEPPAPPAELNGVSDLVALSNTTFLVIERSDSTPTTVRIYRADIGAATDVSSVPSLRDAAVTPMSKSLAADLSTRPGLDRDNPAERIDNIEGITLGPKLPDGRQSVVMVSDDNFSPSQVTQFVLLAM